MPVILVSVCTWRSILLDGVLQEGVETEGVDHQVHGEEEPDVNHLVVRGSRQTLLDTGRDGGDDQHESEADHHPVLESGFVFIIYQGSYLAHCEVCDFKQESEKPNSYEDCLLEEHSKYVVLYLSGINTGLSFIKVEFLWNNSLFQ